MRKDSRILGRVRLWAVAGLSLLLTLGGCGLNEVDIPDLQGPSGLAVGIRMTATPDLISADGFSTSLVSANVSDNNGRPAAGTSIFFAVTDAAGNSADIGRLRSTGPDLSLGTGLVVRTDSAGAARVVYVAPPRTDFTTNGTVLVIARPMADDAQGQIYRTVRIELRSVEPRLFPELPGNSPPSCGFLVEPSVGPYRVNTVVGFQNRSFDADGSIVRYEWFFGDGSAVEHGPDQAHVFRTTGTFVVTLAVTDNGGLRSACSATIPVI